MTKTIAIALVAALGFAGTASAATDAKMRIAQETLNEYGFNVDASTLSDTQISQLVFVELQNANKDVEDNDHSRTSIRAILN